MKKRSIFSFIDGKFNNLRLMYKFSIYIFSFVVLLLILIKLVLITSYYKSLYEIHYKFADEMVSGYAWNSRIPLSKEDYYTLGEYVSAIQMHPDVVYARIFDANGQNVTNRSNRVTKLPANYITIDKSIVYNDENVGRIEVIINRDNISISISKYSWAMVASSASLIIILLLLIFQVVNQYVFKPINGINNAIKKLSMGDLEQTVPVLSKDEIGILAENFNDMLRKLNTSIAMTHSILESAPFSWIAADKDYNILQCNSRIKQFLNLDSEGRPLSLDSEYENIDIYSLSGQNLFETIAYFNRYKQACENVLNIKKDIKLHRELFKENRYIQVHLSPIEIYNGFLIRIDDVTDDETKDAQLRQSLKVESLGILAGGLAHDFNNILSGILSTISILKYKLQNKSSISMDKLESLVDIIDTASNRATDMVKQMLSLSRKQEMNYIPVDLNTCVTHVIKIGKNTFDKCVKIETELYDGKAITMADPNQIESVILNLSINAWHAMTIMRQPDEPQGGTLTIKVELVSTDKFINKQHLNYANGVMYWQISISDTGVGISVENQRKVFDPFFSTKKGKGTGLGLSMVMNIIEQHNGVINLYSEIGVGTRFLIYLPEASANKIALSKVDQIVTIEKGNKETILVVDDEQLVREVVANILEEANYTGIFAENGKEAITIYEKLYRNISFVVLDMSMPELTGLETFKELKKINPEIKAIICSGFNLTEQVNEFNSLGIKAFLEKPFTLAKLSRLIWENLHG